VLKLAPESIEAAPEELKGSVHDDYLEGVGKLKDRLVIILNPGSLLADGEAGSLASGETTRAKAAR
jgi:chemotaxis signal transduction protein